MWLDSISPWVQPVRYVTGYFLALPQQIAVVPGAVSEWFNESSSTRQELMAENKQLAARNLVLRFQVPPSVPLRRNSLGLGLPEGVARESPNV